MSELREQIESARRNYLAATYPGDLAADVMKPATASRMIIRGLVGLAAGVAIVLGVLMLIDQSSPGRRRGTGLVEIERTPPEVTISASVPMPQGAFDLPAMPAPPAGFSLVPFYQPIDLPGIPAFPDVDFESNRENPTTKESV